MQRALIRNVSEWTPQEDECLLSGYRRVVLRLRRELVQQQQQQQQQQQRSNPSDISQKRPGMTSEDWVFISRRVCPKGSRQPRDCSDRLKELKVIDNLRYNKESVDKSCSKILASTPTIAMWSASERNLLKYLTVKKFPMGSKRRWDKVVIHLKGRTELAIKRMAGTEGWTTATSVDQVDDVMGDIFGSSDNDENENENDETGDESMDESEPEEETDEEDNEAEDEGVSVSEEGANDDRDDEKEELHKKGSKIKGKTQTVLNVKIRPPVSKTKAPVQFLPDGAEWTPGSDEMLIFTARTAVKSGQVRDSQFSREEGWRHIAENIGRSAKACMARYKILNQTPVPGYNESIVSENNSSFKVDPSYASGWSPTERLLASHLAYRGGPDGQPMLQSLIPTYFKGRNPKTMLRQMHKSGLIMKNRQLYLGMMPKWNKSKLGKVNGRENDGESGDHGGSGAYKTNGHYGGNNAMEMDSDEMEGTNEEDENEDEVEVGESMEKSYLTSDWSEADLKKLVKAANTSKRQSKNGRIDWVAIAKLFPGLDNKTASRRYYNYVNKMK